MSPVPPVAMAGEPERLINTRPSGMPISVRWPLSTRHTLRSCAKPRAVSTRSPTGWPSSRAISPGCGVRIVSTPRPRKSVPAMEFNRVRIDHHRNAGLPHQTTPHQFAVQAQPRPHGDHGLALQREILERFGHQFRRVMRGIARRDTLTNPAPMRSAASPDMAAAPDLPGEPPHDQHVSEVALVRVALARPEQRREVARVGDAQASKLRSCGGHPIWETISRPTHSSAPSAR